jgi:hypothetical protein
MWKLGPPNLRTRHYSGRKNPCSPCAARGTRRPLDLGAAGWHHAITKPGCRASGERQFRQTLRRSSCRLHRAVKVSIPRSLRLGGLHFRTGQLTCGRGARQRNSGPDEGCTKGEPGERAAALASRRRPWRERRNRPMSKEEQHPSEASASAWADSSRAVGLSIPAAFQHTGAERTLCPLCAGLPSLFGEVDRPKHRQDA